MDLAEAFEISIKDFKFSRAEKKAIAELIKEEPLSNKNKMVLRSKLFGFAKQYSTSSNYIEIIDWLDSTTKLIEKKASNQNDVRSYFSPGDECMEAIIRELKCAKETIDICVFTITDNRIVREIEACFKRNVHVRIISDNDKSFDLGSDIHHLHHFGIPVKIDETEKHMHHKFMIIDNGSVLTGSYNWTRSAATSNEENILITDDPKTVIRFKKEFDKLWTKFKKIND